MYFPDPLSNTIKIENNDTSVWQLEKFMMNGVWWFALSHSQLASDRLGFLKQVFWLQSQY